MKQLPPNLLCQHPEVIKGISFSLTPKLNPLLISIDCLFQTHLKNVSVPTVISIVQGPSFSAWTNAIQ